MQQLDGSSCELFTIVYVVDITFGFNPKQSIYKCITNAITFS